MLLFLVDTSAAPLKFMLWLPQILDRINLVVLASRSWSNGNPPVDYVLYYVACNAMLWFTWSRFRSSYSSECITCFVLSLTGAVFLAYDVHALAAFFLGAGRSTCQSQVLQCLDSRSPNWALRLSKSILGPSAAMLGLFAAADENWSLIIQAISPFYVVAIVYCVYRKDDPRAVVVYTELSVTQVSLPTMNTQYEWNALRSGQWVDLINSVYLAFVVLTWRPHPSPMSVMILLYAMVASYAFRWDAARIPVLCTVGVFVYQWVGPAESVWLGMLVMPALMIQNHTTRKLPSDNCSLFFAIQFDSCCVYLLEFLVFALYPLRVPGQTLTATACLFVIACLSIAVHQKRHPGTFWDTTAE